MKTVNNAGINDGKYPIKDKKTGKLTIEYAAWRNMLARCYVEKVNLKQESYSGCLVSDEFKIYSNFYEWYQENKISDDFKYHLDKDLLLNGNKLYSKDTCLLIPREINNFLTKRDSLRGEFPVGVCFHKPLSKFRAQISKDKKRFHLGYFDNINDAFLEYKIAKEKHAKELADRYKHVISERAYISIAGYIVDIND